ncbi:acyltransferase family protein [Rhizomicrobium electricum]|uniref:acyltransferase family protein n=1 Tax=Rhizomicrobium electricum TaxID=480070 RepID=UPI00141FD4C8|nr:acyltransferase family protein [Rhizomicrobium electricum]NIJ47881.1 peptidoglycan/LPS O-acetylase OafA/YrhL [Rhizomicrobium electricum]
MSVDAGTRNSTLSLNGEPRELKYRPEIDGLRAIAIIPVVLYHLVPSMVPGGFIGVDVFFVISGFLITGILFNDIREGRYSVIRFYRRRVLRIIPALTVMLAFTVLVGSCVLLPIDLRNLGRSGLATSLFSSNILLFHEVGYFDAQADTKPLLHTWSLAVEEQFYVLFPLFMALAYRAVRRHIIFVIAAILTLSFAAGTYVIGRDPNAAFYLPQFRAWELLVGAMFALVNCASLRPCTRRFLAAGGLVAILVSVFCFTSEMPFPGPNALVPVIGAAAIIAAGTNGKMPFESVFCNAPMVFVGKISYSLYLWHWPLIAYAQYYLVRDLTPTESVIAGLLACLAATLSYHVVERPFRIRKFSLRTTFGGAAAATVCFVGFGLLTEATSGMPERFPTLRTRIQDPGVMYSARTCFLEGQPFTDWNVEKCTFRYKAGVDSPKVVLWGDSYAAHLSWGFRQLQQAGRFDLVQITMAACPPFVQAGETTACGRFQKGAWAEVVSLNPDLLVVTMAPWNRRAPEEVRRSMARTLSAAKKRGIHVLLVGELPTYAGPVPQIIRLLQSRGLPSDRYSPANSFRTENALRTAALETSTDFVSLRALLCSGNQCQISINGNPIAWDIGHLTMEGSNYIVSRIAPIVLRSLRTEISCSSNSVQVPPNKPMLCKRAAWNN